MLRPTETRKKLVAVMAVTAVMGEVGGGTEVTVALQRKRREEVAEDSEEIKHKNFLFGNPRQRKNKIYQDNQNLSSTCS